MSERNGAVVMKIQGTRKDFVGAWFMRLLQTLVGAGILWMCKLIYIGVMYIVNTLPPMQVTVKKMEQRLGSLEDNSAEYVTKKDFKRDLSEAELRVRNDFTKQLNQQIKTKGRYAPDGYR